MSSWCLLWGITIFTVSLQSQRKKSRLMRKVLMLSFDMLGSTQYFGSGAECGDKQFHRVSPFTILSTFQSLLFLDGL